MINDSTQLILAVIRGILATVVVYFVPRLYDKYLPKNGFLYRAWHKDEKTRKFIIKYYWLVGLLVFAINIVILYFI